MKTYKSADYHEYFDDSVYPQQPLTHPDNEAQLSDYEHWKYELSRVHTSMDFWLNEYEDVGDEREFQLGMWYEYRDHAIKQMRLAAAREEA
jgi:hypothetical protein